MLYKNAPSGAFFVYNTSIITKAIFIFTNARSKPGKTEKYIILIFLQYV